MFKPLLAGHAEPHLLETLKFPLLASYKLDGIRAMVKNETLVSRNLKPIRNTYTFNLFSSSTFANLDGELIVGSPNDPMCFRKTSSGVMSEEGEPDVTFYVFDTISFLMKEEGFINRYKLIQDIEQKIGKPILRVLHHEVLANLADLNAFELKANQEGYEGIMLRSFHGPYKYGRSSVKEQILLKSKRRVRDGVFCSDVKREEFKIIGFKERMRNDNIATLDALGRTKRTTHKENKSGKNDLGAIIVDFYGEELSVGTGFTDVERKEIWDNQNKYLNKLAVVEFDPYGQYSLPRFPVFIGIRDENDLGE